MGQNIQHARPPNHLPKAAGFPAGKSPGFIQLHCKFNTNKYPPDDCRLAGRNRAQRKAFPAEERVRDFLGWPGCQPHLGNELLPHHPAHEKPEEELDEQRPAMPSPMKLVQLISLLTFLPPQSGQSTRWSSPAKTSLSKQVLQDSHLYS
jgi:hypothetical protein